MTTFALNNLWSYLQGLSLSKSDRKWLAEKLLTATDEDAETIRQQNYVKESLYRALDEVESAKRGESKLMTDDEFMQSLKSEGIV